MTDTPVRLFLSAMLRDPIKDSDGHQIGVLADMVVRLTGDGYPAVKGLVARVGSNKIYVPIGNVTRIDEDQIVLGNPKLDLRPFGRREGEVLLKEAILGHRLIDVEKARLVRAYDVAIDPTPEGWIVAGLDVHTRRWYAPNGHGGAHPYRDWTVFEALIGHEPSAAVRSRFKRLRGLRPAQIADLIEDASETERNDLFGHLHSDPELEADVIEELDDNQQAQVLKGRDTADIGAVLSRMHADDVVDAILDLPQERRQPVLDTLPPQLKAHVLNLMTYQDKTAGGLMGVEYLALRENLTVQDALDGVRHAGSQQPEALTTVYVTDHTDRLIRSISLVALLQAHPTALLNEVAEEAPITVTPADDIVDVVNIMADYNLLTIPVIDETKHLLGIITVDDALEAAIPDDWRQRQRPAS